MLAPATPANEPLRLDTLRSLNILDTEPEERFDRLTRLAKRLFGVPIALVSLVDSNRQWFKSCVGLPVRETSRDISFCGHAILGDDIFHIPDAAHDERFFDNPLVTGSPHIRFYAGCPLRAHNRSIVGTLCLIDDKPRELTDEDRALLHDLAQMAEQELAAVHLATMDELTHLSNRRGFEALAQHALNVCHRMEKPAALLFFDLDGFKRINDSFGHAEGDLALARFAECLRTAFRDSDVIGRLGGDEFVALLTDSNVAETSIATQRLRTGIEACNRRWECGYDIRYSVGEIDFDRARHPSIAALLAEADAAMYARKQMSRSGG
ncbi:MAG TPA: sensor domain-containing diguanylate cyclase [Xanthomonadaceae bacterium]|nr:sensor domain-containing diguanylate cyclase [Xanthomonadaceae bacterium]